MTRLTSQFPIRRVENDIGTFSSCSSVSLPVSETASQNRLSERYRGGF